MKLIEKEHLENVRSIMKDRRIALSLKQTETAKRSGVNINSLRRFEQTGQINFYNLIKLLVLYKMDHRVIGSFLDRDWWTVEQVERSETKRTVR